mmetsp:Transcript_15160/g.22940  ORF Transcript_15160/g.22940 Transcript_15160/m.22940 type:complete len:206 (-) Transcript_15160:201-818(-)|eukprot:CAMPEP_0167747382 /NCGR_PEP_ID=MMETSP0110_2-20121227/4254_1 /TAXON_ID=629695 /ORGANISM="Gymnochlora sp., Strain CCMP2014" /LENGTH=205 /DNA_ID=CAMNT_0007632285 /DNA_START=138 /DNA_END=755 /DNA_ORIENTATION=+
MVSERKADFSFKLALLGSSGVGKSSICVRYISDTFQLDQESTIGAAFHTKTIIDGENVLRLEIWDTAGQERYNSLTPMYYRGAAAAIVVYDVNSKTSYDKAIKWVKQITRKGTEEIPIVMLAGNKIDLPEKGRRISKQEVEAYCKSKGYLFTECSAKTGQGVAGIFDMIASALPKVKEKDSVHEILDLDQEDMEASDRKKKKCCK